MGEAVVPPPPPLLPGEDQTTTTSTNKSSVRVLVCTANLGNAPPDQSSIDAWIPRNGACGLALSRPPLFPVVMDPRRAKNPPPPTAPSPPPAVAEVLSDYDRWLAEQSAGDTPAAAKDDYEAFLAKSQQETASEPATSNNNDDVDDYEAFLARAQQETAAAEPATPAEDDYEAFLASQQQPSVPGSSATTTALVPTTDPPDRASSGGSTSDSCRLDHRPGHECFDIVVIGMQEATFENDADKNSNPNQNKEEEEKPQPATKESVFSDEDDLSVSYRDAPLDASGDGSTATEDEAGGKPKKPTAARKLLGGAIKAGKKGLKAGKKATKATVKTAKDLNTLASERDHSSRPIPSAAPQQPQAGGPIQDISFPGWSDTDILHYYFEGQLSGYERALSYQLGEMRLVVYYKPTAIKLDVLGIQTKPTGKGGLANKGGIVAEVAVNDSTRLSFLTAHLEAHEGEAKYETRNASFREILMGTKSLTTALRYDASQASHAIFAMGDLNYRTRLDKAKPGSDKHVELCHELAHEKDWVTLNRFDELAKALREGSCLSGFRTPYCNFDPTFKVARDHGYSYNPKRSPSYTDRILFKTGDQLSGFVQPILYEPVERFTTSDHKPIRGAFDVRLNESLRWKPLRGTSESAYGVREEMHVFVSSIQCAINPDNYDKIRKVEKAELPNSYLSFVSTPRGAVHIESTDKKSPWLGMGFGRKCMMKSKKQQAPAKKRKETNLKSGFPSTSTIKETMHPNWRNENVYFTVQTHTDGGDPIDLSGGLLHISLFDEKGGKEPKLIGCFSLNLARLIKVSRSDKLGSQQPKTWGRRSSLHGGRGGGRARGGRGPGRQGPRSAGRHAEAAPRSSSSSNRNNNKDPRSAAVGTSPRQSPLRPTTGDDQSKSPVRSNVTWSRRVRSPTPGGGGGPSPKTTPVRSPKRRVNLSPGSNAMVSNGNAMLAPSSSLSPARSSAASREEGRVSRGGRGRGVRDSRAGRRPRKSGFVAPSAALQGAASLDYPTPVRRVSKSLSNASQNPKRAESAWLQRRMKNGPSLSLRNLMILDEEAPDAPQVDETLSEMKVISLTLEEKLCEGGLAVAKLECCMDVWWTKGLPVQILEGDDSDQS